MLADIPAVPARDPGRFIAAMRGATPSVENPLVDGRIELDARGPYSLAYLHQIKSITIVHDH